LRAYRIIFQRDNDEWEKRESGADTAFFIPSGDGPDPLNFTTFEPFKLKLVWKLFPAEN
jgi:hypothetical protein